MRIETKSFALGISIGLIVGIVIHFILPFFFSTPYVRVKVVIFQTSSLTLEGATYEFHYLPYVDNPIVEVGCDSVSHHVNATEGEKCQIFGIEIIISEVHTGDYVVLLVKPL